MRISALATAAGLPLSAVKYYQREGLLPPGRHTAANQAAYDDTHVRRVRLVRALLDVGGLSVAQAREVVAVLDDEEAPLAATFEAAQHALSSPRAAEAEPSDAARQRILRLAEDAGWRITATNPGVAVAARALDGLGAIEFSAPDSYLRAYAEAAATSAAADLAALGERSEPDAVAELMVVGTVLGDPLFAGLRRLAQEHATHYPLPETES